MSQFTLFLMVQIHKMQKVPPLKNATDSITEMAKPNAQQKNIHNRSTFCGVQIGHNRQKGTTLL